MKQFLNYTDTHPNTKLKYIASAMHIWIHSDASYLNEPKAHSRAGDNFYLSDKPNLTIKATDLPPTLNDPILVNRKFIDAFMSFTQELETGSGYINVRDAVLTWTTIE